MRTFDGLFWLMFMTLCLCPRHAKAGDTSIIGDEISVAWETTKGEPFTLEAHRGKVIIMSFWATWCAPCRQEMPHLEGLVKTRKAQGLVAVAVSVDDKRTARRIPAWIKTVGWTSPVVHLVDEATQQALNPTGTLPHLVIVGPDGRVAAVRDGYKPGDERLLAQKIDALLTKSAR